MPPPIDRNDHLRLTPEAATTLAHPLRSRLLSALRVGGPASATGLARELGTNTGATSYHLRRLEDVGLVEDTHEGRGRERVWRASTSSHGWSDSDFDSDPDAAAAVDWLVRDYHRQFDQAYGRWLDAASAWPAAWRDSLGMSDRWLELSAAEAAALEREIDEVVERHAEQALRRRVGRDGAAGTGHEHADAPETRRVHLYRFLFPLDPDDAPTDPA